MSDKVDKMAKVRAAKKPAEYKNVHPDVKALDDDNYLSLKYQIRRMDKGKEQNTLIRELRNREAYLRSLATYLDSGVWLDLFYGQDQENRMRWKTIAFAYDDEGYMKTSNLQQPLDFYEDT